MAMLSQVVLWCGWRTFAFERCARYRTATVLSTSRFFESNAGEKAVRVSFTYRDPADMKMLLGMWRTFAGPQILNFSGRDYF